MADDAPVFVKFTSQLSALRVSHLMFWLGPGAWADSWACRLSMLLKGGFLTETRSQLASSTQINSRRANMSDVGKISGQDQFAVQEVVKSLKVRLRGSLIRLYIVTSERQQEICISGMLKIHVLVSHYHENLKRAQVATTYAIYIQEGSSPCSSPPSPCAIISS